MEAETCGALVLAEPPFVSIDGEVNPQGQGTQSTFIRFFGCNLDCFYCDSPYAKNRDSLSRYVTSVYNVVAELRTVKATITGGEPFMQQEGLFDLLEKLPLRVTYRTLDSQEQIKDERSSPFHISIETNGTVELNATLKEVLKERAENLSLIVDYKTDAPLPWAQSTWDILDGEKGDWVKIPVWDQESFYSAVEALDLIKNELGQRSFPRFAFSPIHLGPQKLFSWMRASSRLADVVLNVQIHKRINFP